MLRAHCVPRHEAGQYQCAASMGTRQFNIAIGECLLGPGGLTACRQLHTATPTLSSATNGEPITAKDICSYQQHFIVIQSSERHQLTTNNQRKMRCRGPLSVQTLRRARLVAPDLMAEVGFAMPRSQLVTYETMARHVAGWLAGESSRSAAAQSNGQYLYQLNNLIAT